MVCTAVTPTVLALLIASGIFSHPMISIMRAERLGLIVEITDATRFREASTGFSIARRSYAS